MRAHQPDVKLQPGDVFGMFQEGDVWVLDLAFGEETKLVENAFNPAYSPDGQYIAVDASWLAHVVSGYSTAKGTTLSRSRQIRVRRSPMSHPLGLLMAGRLSSRILREQSSTFGR